MQGIPNASQDCCFHKLRIHQTFHQKTKTLSPYAPGQVFKKHFKIWIIALAVGDI